MLPIPVSNDPYAAGWQGAQQLNTPGDKDDPSVPDPAYWAMQAAWEPVRACMEGTQYLRLNAAQYLPQNPMELDDAWRGRVSRSVYTPLLQRVIRTATGLVLRKPIVLDGDDFWTEEFAPDVDRMGTSLDEFARNQLFTSIAYGHSAFLVDHPKGDNIRTLRDEVQAQMRSYFVPVDPVNILGWRQDPRENAGQLQQVRIRELASVPKGRFGIEIKERVRVIETNSWELWEKGTEGTNGWTIVQRGRISLGEVPLVATYSGKIATLHSKPPMLELAQLSLAYYRMHADLIHSLHIAAQPILTLRGFDDQQDPIGLSSNSALLLPPEGGAEYVSTDGGAFEAQQAGLDRLADHIRSLGLAILTEEKSGVESAKAKALDRLDSNSMLSVISKDLEQALQRAFNMAGAYMGKEPPVVSIDRDFDVEPIDGQMMTAVNALYQGGLLDQETALRILERGELFDDSINIEDVLENSELEAEAKLERDMARLEGEANVAADFEPEPAPPKAPPKG